MSAREPQEVAEVAVEIGTKKTHRRWDQVLVSSFLAGAYIAFGGLVAITVSSGLDPEIWGTLPTLFTGIAFTLGLVLVLIAGSDLATGNMMLVPLSAMRGRIGMRDVAGNLTLVLIGNLLGALFVAYFLAVQTGADRTRRCRDRQRRPDLRPPRPDRRGQGAARTLRGRPSCAGSAATGWSAWPSGCRWRRPRSRARSWRSSSRSWRSWRWASTTSWRTCSSCRPRSSPASRTSAGPTPRMNWLLAGAGNLVGAVVFVATSYWYLFLKGQPDRPAAAAAGTAAAPAPAAAPAAERSPA